MKEMILARKAELEKRGVKGFTLMEMLIVVAIIAVLVAIAIPVFTTQLNGAKQSADEANARSIYAVATATYMTDSTAAMPTSLSSAKSATLTYQGTDYKFSDVCESVTVGKDASGAPTITVKTNNVTSQFGGTSA